MTHSPRTREEIYESLKDSLTGRIAKLSNFTNRSFNYIWTQAFADEIHELEVMALTSEFAGWIDFVGGPVTETQLENLGLDDRVDAEEINEIMEDEYLDEYVKIVGITRFEGSRATGTVTIDTQLPETTIPEGTIVSTPPDSDGQTLRFETTKEVVSSDTETEITDVPIKAVEVGREHNVPADTIVRFTDPPIGVRGVTNTEATTGGERRETNQELRERAKQQVAGASEGGTVEGIKSYLRQNIEAVREGDVIIDEFTDSRPPFVDVIVDGGGDEEVKTAIDNSRPVGIRHNLIRPEVYQVGLRVDVTGIDIDETQIKETLSNYLLELGISENLYRDVIINLIMEADNNVENIEFLNKTYDRVTNERFTYSQDIDIALLENVSDPEPFIDQTSNTNDAELDDIKLLPESPKVNDAFYFGMDNRFSGFELDISTAGSGDWNIVWEYYDGSNWQLLSNVGTVSDSTNGFTNSNNNIVSWDVPTDWIKNTVNGNTKYFVRARVDTFTSHSQSPLGEQLRVTGSSYSLDLTFENVNGSITVRDANGKEYNKGTDFTMVDKTGDNWPETIRWAADEQHPEHKENFFLDYDVTTEATKHEDEHQTKLVRDEKFEFERNIDEQHIYDVNKNRYKLDFVPFTSSVTIADEDGVTYSQGQDYEIVSVGNEERDEKFTYNTGKAIYYLNSSVDETTVEIADQNSVNYIRGTDYTVIDTNSDGVEDAIEWSNTNDTPNDGDTFTVSYEDDNGIPQTIDWTGASSEPTDNDFFTVTYDKKMYHLEHEVTETPFGEIRDIGGTLYEEDVDYNIVDYSNDNEDDTINFLSNPTNMLNGKEFYVTYITEGDVFTDLREKVDPSTNNITVNVK